MKRLLWPLLTLLLTACVGPQTRSDEAAYWLQYTAPAKQTVKAAISSIMVSPVRAAPGLESARMAYQRETNRLDYYARNRWVDTPAAMLQPLVVRALEAQGAFAAVVQGPAAVQAQRRLDLDLNHLVQDFTQSPSRMRVRLRAQLVDLATQRVLATRVFETQVAAASEDARGGAEAANRALAELLPQLAAWVAEAGAAS